MDPNRQSDSGVPNIIAGGDDMQNFRSSENKDSKLFIQQRSTITRDSNVLATRETERQELMSSRNQPAHMLGNLDMSPNAPFMAACIVLLNIPGFLIDYAQSYQNQLNPCFTAKFGWAKGHEQDIHIAILGASVILGVVIGAFVGGQVMRFSRRHCMFAGFIISTAGNGVSTNLKGGFYWPCIGRFLYGFGVGIYQAVLPKMIEEIVPPHLFSTTMGCFSFAKHSSSFVNFFLAVILPPDSDTAALIATNLWLVQYLYLPAGLSLIFLVSLVSIFRYEPIKFLMRQDKMDQAIKAVQQMYKGAKTKDDALKYIDKIESISGEASSGVTLKDALFSPKYRKATWISFVYVIFHELAGNSLINLYCNQIFKDMESKGNAWVTPRVGTMLVGITAFVSSLFSTQLVRCFGRKTLLLWGHGFIAICHACIAVFDIEETSEGVIIATLLFTVAYQLTTGPVTYIYATETCIDAAMGIIFPALFGTIFMISIVAPIIIDPRVLGPAGTFFILSGLSIVAFFFVLIFMKETYGLTDKEKKEMYMPKKDRVGKSEIF